MIPPPDGIPWLAWATVVVLLALIGGVPAWITARSTRGAIDEVRTDGGRVSVRVGDAVLQVSRRHTRELRDRLVRSARPGR